MEWYFLKVLVGFDQGRAGQKWIKRTDPWTVYSIIFIKYQDCDCGGQVITWCYARKVYNKYKVTGNGLAALFYVIGLSENNNWRLHKCILKCLSLHLWGNIWKKTNQTPKSFYSRLAAKLNAPLPPSRLFIQDHSSNPCF